MPLIRISLEIPQKQIVGTSITPHLSAPSCLLYHYKRVNIVRIVIEDWNFSIDYPLITRTSACNIPAFISDFNYHRLFHTTRASFASCGIVVPINISFTKKHLLDFVARLSLELPMFELCLSSSLNAITCSVCKYRPASHCCTEF